MKPSIKSPEINHFINTTFGVDREKSIENNVCVLCQRNFNPKTEFTDSLSAKEFQISGLCFNCQQKVFGANV